MLEQCRYLLNLLVGKHFGIIGRQTGAARPGGVGFKGWDLIHIAIEYKRFGFVDNLFDWLPPGEDKEVAKLDNSIDIELLMSAERKLLVTQDLDGCNPLLIAIVNGQDKMATRILAKVWPLRPCSNVAAAAPHVPRCTVNPRLCVVCMCAIRSAGDRSG